MIKSTIIERAKEFATKAHASIDQRRKYTNEPYIVHPTNVAYLVSLATDNESAIAAAWLHDVLEDVGRHLTDEIIKIFGEEIYLMVFALTDILTKEDCNRAERKRIERGILGISSPFVQTVKLADIIDNTIDIVKYDQNFAKVFLREVELLLPLLSDGDAVLWHMAQSIIDRNLEKFGIKVQ